MREKGRVEGPSLGGEAADPGQGGIRKCVPSGEVGPWVKGGGEDKPQPLQAGLWIEELIFQLHRKGGQWLIAPGGPPVDQFTFWNGEGDVDRRGLSHERGEGLLKEANVVSLGGRGHCDTKVVNVGDNKRSGVFRWREVRYMTNRRKVMGDPWGTPTET